MKRKSAEERFFSKVTQEGDCWGWRGSASRGLYGHFWTGKYSEAGHPKLTMSHRWAYEFLRADIPEGLSLDHLCRNTLCVNPWHLEPVPLSLNSTRAQGWDRGSCKNNHPHTEKNVYIDPKGRRRCRPCRNAWTREWAKSRKAISTAGVVR